MVFDDVVKLLEHGKQIPTDLYEALRKERPDIMTIVTAGMLKLYNSAPLVIRKQYAKQALAKVRKP